MDQPHRALSLRTLAATISRRRFGVGLGIVGVATGVGLPDSSQAKRKKKKKKCKPACTGGARCQKGKCRCAADAVACGGACIAPDRVCGEVCCPVDVECVAEGCACEEFLCTCAAGRTFCSTPDFTQCCASGDDCDPIAACITDTCTADNDVCTVGGAFCGAGDACLCTTSQAGDPFCADFAAVEECPASSACADDGECGPGETCANVPCCGDDSSFFGLCLPACPALRHAQSGHADRGGERRRVQRVLHLDVGWSRRPQP